MGGRRVGCQGNLRAGAAGVDEGAGVVEVGSAVGGGEFEGLWELGDLSERREGFGGVAEGLEPPGLRCWLTMA